MKKISFQTSPEIRASRSVALGTFSFRGLQLVVLGIFLFLGAWFVESGTAYAVERIALKSAEHKVGEKLAKQNLKNIDVQRIEDPEARKAIKEILRYLRLESKR